jgi:hypothetical protein
MYGFINFKKFVSTGVLVVCISIFMMKEDYDQNITLLLY